MRFLRTLLTLLIVTGALILAWANWHDVTIALWGDLLLDIRLPLLVALAWLAGWLPTALRARAERRRLTRALAAADHRLLLGAAPAAQGAPQ